MLQQGDDSDGKRQYFAKKQAFFERKIWKIAKNFVSL